MAACTRLACSTHLATGSLPPRFLASREHAAREEGGLLPDRAPAWGPGSARATASTVLRDTRLSLRPRSSEDAAMQRCICGHQRQGAGGWMREALIRVSAQRRRDTRAVSLQAARRRSEPSHHPPGSASRTVVTWDSSPFWVVVPPLQWLIGGPGSSLLLLRSHVSRFGTRH